MNMKRTNKVRGLVQSKAPRAEQEETRAPSAAPSTSATPITGPTLPTTQEVVNSHDLDLTPDLVDALDKKRNSHRGRRLGQVRKEPQPRATFILPTNVTQKMKYIAIKETKLYSEVVREALERYISEYETGNGEILM